MYFSTLWWLTYYCGFISLQIPELVIRTIHQFIFFQVSNTALALPNLSQNCLGPSNGTICWLEGS